MNPEIFREYDIRGIYEKDLTEEVVQRIGVALSEKFPGKRFVVGNDIRASGKPLASALIKGLQTNAGEITYLDTTAFGEALTAGWKLQKDITIYLTASHLPPEWNGIKIYYSDGEAICPAEIKDLALKADLKTGNTKIISENFNNKYVDYLKSKFHISKKLKVVVDCGNGSTCLTAPKVFKALGFETIVLFGDVDPKFSGRTADIKPNELTALKEKVLSEKADFGVAFDGDGDRFLLIDEKGNIYRSDKVGLMLAKQLLPISSRKKIIITVSVSMASETELKPLSAEIIKVPVGHTFIINESKKQNALIGMEESGHLVIPEYALFDDGLIPAIKTAEIICNSNKKLSELMAEIPNYPFEEYSFACADHKKFDFVKQIAKTLLQKHKVSELDGARVDFDDGWILIRAANTSPKIRLYVEATTQKRFDELKNEFTKLINIELKKI